MNAAQVKDKKLKKLFDEIRELLALDEITIKAEREMYPEEIPEDWLQIFQMYRDCILACQDTVDILDESTVKLTMEGHDIPLSRELVETVNERLGKPQVYARWALTENFPDMDISDILGKLPTDAIASIIEAKLTTSLKED